MVLCALARRLGTRRSYPGRTFVDRTLGLPEGYRLTLKDFDDGGLVSRTLRRGTGPCGGSNGRGSQLRHPSLAHPRFEGAP